MVARNVQATPRKRATRHPAFQWTAHGPLLAAAPKVVAAVLSPKPAARLRPRMAAGIAKATPRERATRLRAQGTAHGPLLATAPKLVAAVLSPEPAATLRPRMAARLVKATTRQRATRKPAQGTAHGPLLATAPKVVAAVLSPEPAASLPPRMAARRAKATPRKRATRKPVFQDKNVEDASLSTFRGLGLSQHVDVWFFGYLGLVYHMI